MKKREAKILAKVKEFAEKLPKFSDGRIDYSDSNIAPVVIVFLRYGKEFLLLKRSEKGLNYRGKWSVVAGFLDEVKPIQDKVLEEVQEELAIQKDDILKIHIGEPYEFEDTEIDKTWIRCPVLVELKRQVTPRLDWEHEEYKWVKLEQFKDFDTVPSLAKSLNRALE